MGMVSVKGVDAFRLHLFNPKVESHKSRMLKKIVSAGTFQRHWPAWLDERVQQFLRDGLSPVKIRDKLLFEFNTYTKLKTIKWKQRQMRQELGAGGGIPIRLGGV